MSWTTTRPSEPGWYWFERTFDGVPQTGIVQVLVLGGEPRLLEVGSVYTSDPHSYADRWQGPLQPPAPNRK